VLHRNWSSELTRLGGFAPKVDPANVAIIGLRSVDEAERQHVREAGVHAYTMRDLDERGLRSVLREAIDRVSEGTAGFHLSFDMDSVDPSEAPALARPCARHDLSRGASAMKPSATAAA